MEEASTQKKLAPESVADHGVESVGATTAAQVRHYVVTHRPEALAAVVLALLAVNLLSVIRQKTITNDELVHIPAGYYQLVDGTFQFNNEHPPLVKMWAALPLLLIQPDEQRPPDLPNASSAGQTWAYLESFWTANEKRFVTIAFWPRVMMVPLTSSLLIARVSLRPSSVIRSTSTGFVSSWQRTIRLCGCVDVQGLGRENELR